MGWPKGKKKGVDGTVAEEVKPYEYIDPINPAKEDVISQEVPVGAKYICRDCKHDENIHYEGRDRQCNTSGCRCVRLAR